MDSREAHVALNLIEGVGPVRVRQLLEHFGDAPAILAASRTQLVHVPGIGDDTAAAIANWEQTVDLPGELKRIEISGDAGSAIVREEDLAVWKFAKETSADEAIRQKMSSRTQTGGGAADPKAIGHHGHMLQFQDVLAAVKKGKRPLIDGPEGRKAVELILAVYKSAETGKPVKLPLAGDPALKARAKGKK